MSADKVQAYVFEKQGAELVRKEVDQVPLGANDVEVDITVVSLCHTDLSLGLNDWKVSQYVAAPGAPSRPEDQTAHFDFSCFDF